MSESELEVSSPSPVVLIKLSYFLRFSQIQSNSLVSNSDSYDCIDCMIKKGHNKKSKSEIKSLHLNYVVDWI